MPVAHRYLVRFDPKRVPHYFTDVLVIGGGIAGTRAALAIDESQDVVVVSKDVLTHSNSAWAQGGIAGVLDPLDDVAHHAADTIAAGKGLCNVDVVNNVVEEASLRIHDLINYGTRFDEEDGEIALTREGGHSHRRVAHALGDATGKEIMRAMSDQLRSADNISIWEETFTIDLLTHEGEVRGALVWHRHHGKTYLWAKQTILCTGGAGRMYRETTNPEIATGDGHALAFRAGAAVRDMEFMQFHPTVLYIAGSSRHLITEAIRGEGAYLVDANGYRFMQDYHSDGELAPRDDVSRAMTDQMEKTRHPCMYLDLSHLPRELVLERFPHIRKVCSDFGIDITCDPIPVRPGAHYMIGGLVVDDHGQTTLPGLWAAGEATSTGLHGANRLASNSLLEGLVYGLRAGEGASRLAQERPDTFQAIPLRDDGRLLPASEEDLNLTDVRNSLTSLMWRNVGIRREADSLKEAATQVDFWNRYVAAREFSDPQGWELQNLLLIARCTIAAALARTESRGVHFRSDHPQPETAWERHLTISRQD